MLKETFAGLDALRGYAAVAILIVHSRLWLDALWFMQSGYLAVDLFFLMSGFVIAHSYGHRMKEMGVVGFMRVRLIRFAPLYWLGGAITLSVLVARELAGKSVEPYILPSLAYAFFLPNPNVDQVELSLMNIPGWSLLLEIYVNLLFALFFPFLTNRTLWGVVCVTAAILLGLGVTGGPTTGGAHWEDVWIGCVRILFSFSLGVLAYRFRDRLPHIPSTAGWLLVAMLAAFLVPTHPAWDLAFVFFVSPLLCIAALSMRGGERVARFGANTSYAIYAIHYPVIMSSMIAARFVGIPEWIGVALSIPFVLAVTPLLDRYFDRPIRKWMLTRPQGAPMPDNRLEIAP